MPGQVTNDQAIKRLSHVSLFLPTAGGLDQTTAASTPKGNSDITLPALTGGADGDHLLIVGANGQELNAINGAPALAMPLKYKTAFLHPAGTRVREVTEIPLGRIEVGGFTISPSQQQQLIEAADLNTPMQTINGTLEIAFSVGLLNHNARNWLAAFGYEDNETGTGTAADPWQSTIGDPLAALITMGAIRTQYLLFSGYTLTADLTNISIAPSGSIAMGAKNSASVIPFAGKASFVVRREWI